MASVNKSAPGSSAGGAKEQIVVADIDLLKSQQVVRIRKEDGVEHMNETLFLTVKDVHTLEMLKSRLNTAPPKPVSDTSESSKPSKFWKPVDLHTDHYSIWMRVNEVTDKETVEITSEQHYTDCLHKLARKWEKKEAGWDMVKIQIIHKPQPLTSANKESLGDARVNVVGWSERVKDEAKKDKSKDVKLFSIFPDTAPGSSGN